MEQSTTGDKLPSELPSRRERYLRWLKSTNFFVYCSHSLSAWGDRMWWFAVGLFLFKLEEGTLQLTAIYSFTIGASILLFGALIGSWIDKYPRLRVAQVSLVIQNTAVITSALILCLVFSFKDQIYSTWDGGLATLCHILLIAVADIARMASMASSITIQKDWVVVICRGSKAKLANLNAVMRRIDLLTNILAPVLVGQIMTYASMLVGAIFIACWNLVSVFLEYYLLWKVYKRVPQLAVKGKPVVQEMEEENPKSVEMKDFGMNDGDDNQPSEEGTNVTAEKPNKDEANDSSGEVTTETVDETTKRDDPTSDIDDITAHSGDVSKIGDKKGNEQTATTGEADSDEPKEVDPDSSDVPPTDAHKHETEDIATAEDKLLNKSKPGVEEADEKKTKTCFQLVFSNVFILVRGWKVYMRQDTVFAGLGLASLYMTVLGFDVITNAYGYSQGLSESILGVCMALGALAGIVGTLIFPWLRSKVGLERTGLFSSAIQISFLSLCVLSIWLPGSPFDLNFDSQTSSNRSSCNISSTTETPTDVITNLTGSPVYSLSLNDSNADCSRQESEANEYASVVVIFVGLVFSRAGLWMFDLTVTQIVQESVMEHERGVVGGVQTSINMLLDMLKNIMVIAAPHPETFGILIIISFSFIVLGGILYSLYSKKVRGHLFHVPPKCIDRNGNMPNGGQYSDVQTEVV